MWFVKSNHCDFIYKSVDKISQLLDYLLSPAFLLTKFSQKFHSADKVKLESVKKSIGSIFIEKHSSSTPFSSTASTPKVSASTAASFASTSTAESSTDTVSNDPTLTPIENLMIKKLLDQNKMMFESFFGKTQNSALINNPEIINTNQTNVGFNLNNDNLEPDHLIAKFKNLVTKLQVKLHHMILNDTHLENGTTPASLFYNRMPTPMLQYNPAYVNDYNDLCI